MNRGDIEVISDCRGDYVSVEDYDCLLKQSCSLLKTWEDSYNKLEEKYLELKFRMDGLEK